MSKSDSLPIERTHHVRDTCLCLHVQRAGRALARRFDEALQPVGLTSGQFSLLAALNRAAPPTMGQVAATLAMDRTTLTANLKPLQRRKLVKVVVDPEDRRGRRLHLTSLGRKLMADALPVWTRTHAELDALLSPGEPDRLRAGLGALI